MRRFNGSSTDNIFFPRIQNSKMFILVKQIYLTVPVYYLYVVARMLLYPIQFNTIEIANFSTII